MLHEDLIELRPSPYSQIETLSGIRPTLPQSTTALCSQISIQPDDS